MYVCVLCVCVSSPQRIGENQTDYLCFILFLIVSVFYFTFLYFCAFYLIMVLLLSSKPSETLWISDMHVEAGVCVCVCVCV